MLARHGPHHVAQKSTITGFWRRSEDLSGLPSSVFTVNDGAGRAQTTSGVSASNANVAAVIGRRGECFVRRTGERSSRFGQGLTASALAARTLTANASSVTDPLGIFQPFDRDCSLSRGGVANVQPACRRAVRLGARA